MTYDGGKYFNKILFLHLYSLSQVGSDDRSTGSSGQVGEEYGEGEQLGGNKGLEWGESLMKSFCETQSCDKVLF